MSYSDYGAYIWKNGVDITKQFADMSFYFSDGWKEVEEESEIKDQPIVEGHAVLIFKNFAIELCSGKEDFYKQKEEIINNIQDTVEIQKIIKPIYNFKAKN